MSRFPLPALALAALLSAAPVAGQDEKRPDEPWHPSAGGRLAWIFSDDLDLAGGLWIDVPLALDHDPALYVGVAATTAIRRATSLAFDVRDVEYRATFGLRGRTHRGWLLAGFVEQWGKERTDSIGSSFLRGVGFEIESRGHAVEGGAAAALVVDERGVEAAAFFRGNARVSFPGAPLRAGLDARVEALAGGDGWSVDLEVGPRIDVLRAPTSTASFFLHYLRARTPLGLSTSGIVLGFEDAGGAHGLAASPPEVRGSVAVGGGGERGAGRLVVRFLAPAFLRDRAWVIGDFDLNVVTGGDVAELFYIYDVGLETRQGGATEGIYFRHRSNHRLSQPGSSVTSMNVIEAGIETPAWSNPAALRRGTPHGAWDARARVGLLLDTSFGDSGRLHATAGARYVLPRRDGARVLPYARVEVEDGEVGRRSYALGAFVPRDVDLKLEYLRDSQFYGRDKTALLLTAGISF